jgi:hypothetical protein
METQKNTISFILSEFRTRLGELLAKRHDMHARLLRAAETKKTEDIRKKLGI